MKLSGVVLSMLLLPLLLVAQPAYRKVSVAQATVGVSAVSLNTLTAKSFFTGFPIYSFKADSLSGQFVFSIRQLADDGASYQGKSFIGAIDCLRDSLRWYSESNTFGIRLHQQQLFFSSESKTSKVNLLQGFEEVKYASPLLAVFPGRTRGLVYVPAGSEVVSCVNLSDGAVFWTAAVSGAENWVDAQVSARDSVLVVAAAGLVGLHPYKGAQWSYPLVTSDTVDQALTYSPMANPETVRALCNGYTTSRNGYRITELASNILSDASGHIYFASKEKMIAVDAGGKLVWELDLRAYPISKMCLRKNGNSIALLNLGVARYADTYVNYGKPFAMLVDADKGTSTPPVMLDSVANLVDLRETSDAWLLASRTTLLRVNKSSCQAETLLSLDTRSYGNIAGFIDGDRYYTEKENFYVPLNFINDNPVYFRAENNKIYGTSGNTVSYEYHFNELYYRELSFSDKLLLRGDQRSLIVNRNLDLLATLDQPYRAVVAGSRLVLVNGNHAQLLDLSAIR